VIKENQNLQVELTANEWQYIVDALLSHASNMLAVPDVGEVHRLYGLRVLEIKEIVESQLQSK